MLDLTSLSQPRISLRLASCLLLLCACSGKDRVLTDAHDAASDTATTAGTGTTTEGGETAPTTGDTGDTGTGVDSEGGATTAGTAFLRADKPPPPPGIDPPPGTDPNDLLVDVGDFALTCDDPYGFPACAPRSFYRFSFVLSPDRQQPGTYAAIDLGAKVYQKRSQAWPCELFGPADVDGTIEVVSITADGLVLRLPDWAMAFPSFDGEYNVTRCAG